MQRLEPPDTHHFSAAIVGWNWACLPNPERAGPNHSRAADHPDCWKHVGWSPRGKAMGGGFTDRTGLIATGSKNGPPAGCIKPMRCGAVRTAAWPKAWDALLPAFDRFPKEPSSLTIFPVTLARCSNWPLARLWIKRAAAIRRHGRSSRWPARPDLEQLWRKSRHSDVLCQRNRHTIGLLIPARIRMNPTPS